jgi:long-chain acyl-CoA synthetase
LDYVHGDVSLPRWGLLPARREELIDRTTHIIHGAATIGLDNPLQQARAINFEGTRRALQIALECHRRGRLEKFVHIGTVSVSGNREGDIYEHELEMGQHFLSTYERSKFEAEQLVRCYMDQLPITIFRPSIVVGDSRTGRTTEFNVIYYPLRLLCHGRLPFLPGTPDTLLDVVPIDWVVEAMSIIISSDQSTDHTYHLAAGPNSSTRLADFLCHAVSYLDRHCPLNEPRRVDIVDLSEYQRRFAQLRGMKASLYRALWPLLGYLTVRRQYDTTNVDEALQGCGLQCPEYLSYADDILDCCLSANWGKRAGEYPRSQPTTLNRLGE